jgi:hypothetical protein
VWSALHRRSKPCAYSGAKEVKATRKATVPSALLMGLPCACRIDGNIQKSALCKHSILQYIWIVVCIYGDKQKAIPRNPALQPLLL